MNIAIIGAGHVGRSLGLGWARAGHVIRYGVKDPEDDQHADLLKAVGAASHSGAAPDALTVAEAAEVADAILLAVPWSAMPDVMERIAPVSTGKLVIDATNPLAFGPQGELRLAIGFSTSGGEEVAKLAPGAAVFKTMNQVGYAVMPDAGGFPVAPVMFVAGDDAARKPEVMALVSDLGFDAVDAGPLAAARLLEPYAMLWIDQALNRGAPQESAFAFMRGKAK
jgi:8-hydroxy-5-deazaflavin:NADPH oxidoreductase